MEMTDTSMCAGVCVWLLCRHVSDHSVVRGNGGPWFAVHILCLWSGCYHRLSSWSGRLQRTRRVHRSVQFTDCSAAFTMRPS